MADKKNEEDTVPAAPATEPAPPPAPKTSFVDAAFDTLTAWAAHGLDLAKRGLETSARWLDARAKRVGDVATRLSAQPSAAGEQR